MLKAKPLDRNYGQLSESERKTLEKLYTQGPAAYGSVENLNKASRLPKRKVETFLSQTDAHTKHRAPRKKFPQIKVHAYRINEIWSLDVAYMDKLAKYNNGVKYLLVAVDVLLRFLRVEPMKTKRAADSTRAFKRMITKSIPEKIWSDKGSEFEGEFKQFCDSINIDIYSTHSETKSAFAERTIHSLKIIIQKQLEKRWSYQYIKKLHDFVDIINSRVNGMTELAPKKISDKDVPHLTSLVSNKSTKQLRVPKFRAGHFVSVSKENLPFKRLQNEIFQIEKSATLNIPTNNLLDSAKEKLLGKFYQPEMILVKKKNGRI